MDHPIYRSDCKNSETDKQFYLNNVVMDRENIINLCCETLKQSNCSKWFKARQSRISASQNVHSIKIRNKKTQESLVMDMLNPKNIESKSTLYDTKNEQEAKEMAEKLYGVEGTKLGVLVSERQPWLC